MRRSRRLLPVVCLLACAFALSGCESLEGLTDVFGSSKTKLTGERKPVFPDGVPGVTQGIPPDLMKDNPNNIAQQPPGAPNTPVQAATVQPPAEHPTKPLATSPAVHKKPHVKKATRTVKHTAKPVAKTAKKANPTGPSTDKAMIKPVAPIDTAPTAAWPAPPAAKPAPWPGDPK